MEKGPGEGEAPPSPKGTQEEEAEEAGEGEEEEEGGLRLELLARKQRKEKRELQAKIQGMKNTVPKNDKKRRKQLLEDVAKLEAELEEKHRGELKHLKETLPEQNKEHSATINIARLELEGTGEIQPPRISKAQKRRDKKAALEKEREERIAEAEIENLTGARHLESQKLAHILATRQLEIKQIPSDGHCMYRAIEDQLRERQNSWTVATLRSRTAEYMRGHVDDFLPFLTNPNTGDLYSREEFEKYCYDIANTASWGGQLELRALSHILQTPIEVVQVDSPPIIVGEEYNGDPLILVYMRHAYGLGEHYNSVKPLLDKTTENES
ncbi:deubiquitinase OTUD6B [Sceloporus undulatus]|uniref:deubiquitinase OTUD6B n=1 Tax=Sceloporus undulatus TaxID=8520 RepID=UPI001C4D28BA|nr:deubiquitinase OTUD6B [Sceloporus undulatus]